MSRRLTLYAHRGIAIDCRENTAAAFDAALHAGFDAFELDLIRLSDGAVVVFHDFSLRRQFRSFRRLKWISLPQFRKINPEILTFDEFMERYGQKNITVNFEIKDDPHTLHLIQSTLRDFQGTVVSSFERGVVDSAVDIGLTAGYLFEKVRDFKKQKPTLKTNRIHISKEMLEPPKSAELFTEYDVHVYTINDVNIARGVIEHPFVSGIFTDNPELAKAFPQE